MNASSSEESKELESQSLVQDTVSKAVPDTPLVQLSSPFFIFTVINCIIFICSAILFFYCFTHESPASDVSLVLPGAVRDPPAQAEGLTLQCPSNLNIHCKNETEKIAFFHYTRALQHIFSREQHLFAYEEIDFSITLRTPKRDEQLRTEYGLTNCTERIHGSFIFFYIENWFDVFAHYLIDRMPILLYLMKKFQHHTFLLPAGSVGRSVMSALNLDPRIHWLEIGSTVCADENSYILSTTISAANGQTNRNNFFFTSAVKSLQPLIKQAEKRTVLFLSRRSQDGGEAHGRSMTLTHEAKLLRIIQRELKQNHRQEELVVVHGSNMTLLEQMELFRSATAIIGPHGGAFANLIWTESRPCTDRVKVLEFVCGKRSKQVQDSCPYAKTYWRIYMSIPHLEYHSVIFREDSDADITYVDIDDFTEAVNQMFTEELPK